MARKRGHGWTRPKRSRNPGPRQPQPLNNPPAPTPTFNQPTLGVLARRTNQHMLTYLLGHETDIGRNIIGHLTPIEAVSFSSASRQLRNVLASQAGGRGPPNIANLANWLDPNFHCQEEVRGGLANAVRLYCGSQAGLQSCMGPCQGPSFNGRIWRNLYDWHRPHICQHCHTATDAACEVEERVALQQHQIGMCEICVTYWRGRHRMGWKTCICKTHEEERYCWFCRTDKQVQWCPIRVQNRVRYEHAYRSRGGEFKVDMARTAEPLPRCHCGRKHTNHAQRQVAMCLICEGIVVTASAVTGRISRRSERSQKKYDEEDGRLPER